jgi:hypothetical protein
VIEDYNDDLLLDKMEELKTDLRLSKEYKEYNRSMETF